MSEEKVENILIEESNSGNVEIGCNFITGDSNISLPPEVMRKLGSWLGECFSFAPKASQFVGNLLFDLPDSWLKQKSKTHALKNLNNYLVMLSSVVKYAGDNNIKIRGEVQYEDFFITIGGEASKIEEKSNPELFNIWRDLILSYLEGDNRHREQCVKYSKLLSTLDSRDVRYLDLLYNKLFNYDERNQSKPITKKDFDADDATVVYSELIRLSEKQLIALQGNGTGPITGKSVSTVFNLGRFKFDNYLVIHINQEIKEFVDFMNRYSK